MSWEAILAGLTLQKDAPLQVVLDHLKHTPKPHAFLIQNTLLNSGCAVDGFDPDGDVAEKTIATVENLHAEYTKLTAS